MTKNAARTRWLKPLIICGVILTLLVGGWFVGSWALRRSLSSENLQDLASRKTAKELKAEAGYLPLEWDGSTVHSAGFVAKAQPPRELRALVAHDLEADVNLLALIKKKVLITQLRAGRLEAAYGDAGAKKVAFELDRKPDLLPPSETDSGFNVDIRNTLIERGSIFWGSRPQHAGSINDTKAKVITKGKDLVINGDGGTFKQSGFPEADIRQFEMHYTKEAKRIEIQSASLGLGESGGITATGTLDFSAKDAGFNLNFTFESCPASSFLSDKWSKNLNATFHGEARVEQEPKEDATTTAEGHLKVSDGTLKGLDALDKIADASDMAQLRQLRINSASADFYWSGSKLTVENFRASAEELLRAEGNFSIQDKKIDGNFKLGVKPRVIGPIPGAREYVFTEQRDGYLWAPVRLSGPLSDPRQDLKERLVDGARRKIFGDIAKPITAPVKEVLGVLDSIFGED